MPAIFMRGGPFRKSHMGLIRLEEATDWLLLCVIYACLSLCIIIISPTSSPADNLHFSSFNMRTSNAVFLLGWKIYRIKLMKHSHILKSEFRCTCLYTSTCILHSGNKWTQKGYPVLIYVHWLLDTEHWTALNWIEFFSWSKGYMTFALLFTTAGLQMWIHSRIHSPTEATLLDVNTLANKTCSPNEINNALWNNNYMYRKIKNNTTS